MRKRIAALALVSAVLILGRRGPSLVFGADTLAAQAPGTASASAPVATDGGAALKETEARRRDTLKYGIESEIFDLLDGLKSDKDGGYNAEIFELFGSSKSIKLRSAILDFWSTLEWKGGEAGALDIVETRDGQDPAIVASALAYLSQIRSQKALEFAKDLLKEGDKKILPSLLKLLGRAGGLPEEELLLGYLDNDDATEDLKQSAIRALGDFGSAKASERLMKIVEDSQGSKTTRMLACEALGKIGQVGAVKSLVIAANGEDVNVRASAIGALGNFNLPEAGKAIQASLRDTAVQVRVAGCKALALRKMDEAVPALIYKASYDPEKAVRTEAFKALGEIGGREAFAFLRTFLDTPKNDSNLRVLAFGVLLRKDRSSIPVLEARMVAEAKEKDRSFYTSLARDLASGELSPEGGALARVLFADSDYLMRLGGLEWARRNKAPGIRPDLERLSASDPSDYIKKKAQEILASYR